MAKTVNKTSFQSGISEQCKKNLREDLMDYEMEKAQGKDVIGPGAMLHSLASKYGHEGVTFYIARNNYYGDIKGMFDNYTQESYDELLIDEPNEEEVTKSPTLLPVEDKKDEEILETLKLVLDEKKEIRKGTAKVIDIDKSIENFAKKTTPLNKPKYLSGQRVDIRVNAVRSYGALVETVDGHAQGLIHISNMREHFISDPNQYFAIDDIVQGVKILKVERDGKLSLSTIDTKLPLKTENKEVFDIKEVPTIHREEMINNPLAEKLGSYKEQLLMYNAEPKNTTVSYSNEGIDNELSEMTAYIRGIVGALSPEAEKLASEIKSKHKSVFKMTRAIMEIEKGFDPDLSLLFMKQVAERLDGGL